MKASLSDICKRVMAFWLEEQGLSFFLVLLFLALFLGPYIDSPLVRLLTSLFLSLLMVAGVIKLSGDAQHRTTGLL